MKNAAVKKIAAVVFVLVLLFAFQCNAFAETIQDSLEQKFEDLLNNYNSADSESQESFQDTFSSIVEQFGLGDIDLGSLTETDIGQIIGDLGNNLAMDSLLDLAEEAWASGSAMVQDVFDKGLGTSDGSNTATTKPSAGGSPNIIIAETSPQGSTNAVGVPNVTNPATYNSAETAAPDNIVGAGVTTAGTTVANAQIDDQMGGSTVAVLVVLSVSTVAVIVALVIFFVLKKK